MSLTKYMNSNIINKKQNLLINIIFAFFPISLLLGNLIVNLNFLLFCALGIIILKLNFLKIKFNLPFKFIFIFFCIIVLSTLVSFITHLYYGETYYVNLNNLIKSVLFFRFFLMLIIIYHLNKLNILNFKYFFFVGGTLAALISLDIIFQYLFGFNIVGLPSYGFHNTSFFADEMIAGGFVLRFCLFSLFFSIFILNKKNYINFFLITFLIVVLGMGVLLSGNRMPFLFYFFALFLTIFFNKELRKYIIAGILLLSVTCWSIFALDTTYKKNYQSIYGNIINISNLLISPFNKGSDIVKTKKINQIVFGTEVPRYESAQRRLILTAIDTWKFSKVLGNGFKSFRKVCEKLDEEFNMQEDMRVYLIPHEAYFEENRLCSNHPHNYYFEILTELGAMGVLITLIMAYLFLFFIFNNLKSFNQHKLDFMILSAATLSLIVEMFPLKSSGSLFTTSNATYIILIVSIFLCNKKLLKI